MLRDESLKIYIDRLKGGHEIYLNEEVSAYKLFADLSDVHFVEPIKIYAKVYLADHQLICSLDVEAHTLLPCVICNQEVRVAIKKEKVYFVKPVQEIKGAIFDLGDWIRETILLEVPEYVECHGGCPGRKDLSKYMEKCRKESEKTSSPFDVLSTETFY